MNFADLVIDWGGFEKLIATLHETGDVNVEHNVVITGRSGSDRQIDVLIRHKQGLYSHIVVAECKHWNKRISRLHVDALAKTIEEVGASRGVIFSTKGFQSGAVTQARHDNIDLFIVRDLTPEEWGLPGRIIDFFLQIVQLGIGNFTSPGATMTALTPAPPSPPKFEFIFGLDGPESTTSILRQDGTPSEKSLEAHIYDAAKKGFEAGLSQLGTVNSGQDCTAYIACPVNLHPNEPFRIVIQNVFVQIPALSFTVGIKISQSRFVFDRGETHRIALALENLVTGVTSTASRRKNDAITVLSEIDRTIVQNTDEILKNGSIVRIQIKGMFPYDEMAHLTPIPIEDVTRPFIHPPLPEKKDWKSTNLE